MKRLCKLFSFCAFISAIALLLAHTPSTNAAILPRSLELLDTLNAYPLQPNEVLPIQPVLLYPTPHKLKLEGRTLNRDDDDIIYVQLLKRKSYQPKQLQSADDKQQTPTKELTMKDIFYVKALANGQFSHQRVKWFRLPEFYAISVYRKGENM